MVQTWYKTGHCTITYTNTGTGPSLRPKVARALQFLLSPSLSALAYLAPSRSYPPDPALVPPG
eukprot:3015166-Rhodomonas_salina.1